ncbi:hypothetical protein LCGC14_2882230, partial [marine sediment metagenome]
VVEKATPVNADLLLIEDSAAANAKKKVQVGNLPGGGGGGGTSIEDADSNTKVQTEESADENKIRFDVAATERLVLQDSSPHLTLTGDQKISGQLALAGAGDLPGGHRTRPDAVLVVVPPGLPPQGVIPLGAPSPLGRLTSRWTGGGRCAIAQP